MTPLGGAGYYGSAYGRQMVSPIVSLVPTPDRNGYWLVGGDGTVRTFGDAAFKGDAGGAVLKDRVVAAAATPDGAGYWLVSASGQVLSFGDATNYGSIAAPFAGLVVGIIGDLRRAGLLDRMQFGGRFQLRRRETYSLVGVGLSGETIVSAAAMPDGGGYFLAAADGSVFSFGDAPTTSRIPRSRSPRRCRLSRSRLQGPEPGSPSRMAPC